MSINSSFSQSHAEVSIGSMETCRSSGSTHQGNRLGAVRQAWLITPYRIGGITVTETGSSAVKTQLAVTNCRRRVRVGRVGGVPGSGATFPLAGTEPGVGWFSLED